MRRTVLIPTLVLALAAGCARKESPATAAAAEERKAASAATAGVLVPESPAHGAPLPPSATAAGVPKATQPAPTRVAGAVPAPVSAHGPARQ